MPRKILLADDSVTAQNMGRRILSEAGYEVVTVNNGSAALKKLAELKPDLVILDIYMPGYSGIEVCQKIKEDLETSNLPVLLTVGKLEPFKAEEARRVHADAHLVKPFEATELLAALTKLEDKVVPGPEVRPAISGKGKTTEKAGTSGKDKKFGDSETGWKQRLKISKPGPKRQGVQEKREEKKTSTTAFREIVREEAPEPAAAAVSVAEALPPDITAEEIAAIASAAAALEGGLGESEPSYGIVTEVAPSSPPADSTTTFVEAQEDVAEVQQVVGAPPVEEFSLAAEAGSYTATFPEAQAQEQPHAEALVEDQPVEQVRTEEYEEPEPQPVEPAVETAAMAEEISAPPVVPAEQTPTDAEVTAALEALAPVNEGAFPAAGQSAVANVEIIEEGIARFGREWGAVSAGGRWIAQEVAISAEEGALILEEEMQKARAALAEIELEITQPLEAHAEVAVAEDSASSAYEQAEPPYESSQPEISEARPEEPALISALDSSAPGVEAREPEPVIEAPVEPVALETAEEAASVSEIESAPTPEPEPKVVEAIAQSEVTTVNEAAQMPPPPEPAEVSAEVAEANAPREEAAYAAAAAVSTDFRKISRVEAAPAVLEPEPEIAQSEIAAAEAPLAEAPAMPSEQEATLAAAWANWRQIRESIASPQFTQQVADVAAAGYKEIHLPEPAASHPSNSDEDKSPALVADSAAIASIVDSVLAELKPKLVEEIARKLGKEKK